MRTFKITHDVDCADDEIFIYQYLENESGIIDEKFGNEVEYYKEYENEVFDFIVNIYSELEDLSKRDKFTNIHLEGLIVNNKAYSLDVIITDSEPFSEFSLRGRNYLTEFKIQNVTEI